MATASFVSKGNENKIYATSVCEIFDRKVGVKHLPFFLSGKVSEDLLNCWIAKKKIIFLPIRCSQQGVHPAKKENVSKIFC